MIPEATQSRWLNSSCISSGTTSDRDPSNGPNSFDGKCVYNWSTAWSLLLPRSRTDIRRVAIANRLPELHHQKDFTNQNRRYKLVFRHLRLHFGPWNVSFQEIEETQKVKERENEFPDETQSDTTTAPLPSPTVKQWWSRRKCAAKWSRRPPTTTHLRSLINFSSPPPSAIMKISVPSFAKPSLLASRYHPDKIFPHFSPLFSLIFSLIF